MKSHFCRLIYFALVGLLFVTADLAAQQSGESRQSFAQGNRRVVPRETDQRLMAARKQMSIHEFGGAAALLELILKDRPDDPVIQNLLMTCYEQTKQYPGGEALARRIISVHPENLDIRLKLARFLALQGKKEESAVAYYEAAQSVGQVDPVRHQRVLVSMISYGLAEQGLALVDSLRLVSGEKMLFALERGSIFEKQQRFVAATEEYLRVLEQDSTRNAVSAERRLTTLLEFIDSATEVERALLVAAKEHSNPGATRVLAAFYIKDGRFDDVFEFAIQQDSLGTGTNNVLLFFLYRCAERSIHQQVVRMAEYVIPRYGESIFLRDVKFHYARALRGVGRPEDAIGVYQGLMVDTVDLREKAEILEAVGEIYLDDLRNYPSALACFDSVVTRYRAGVAYLQAARGIPTAYLRMGQLDESRKRLEALSTRHLNDDMREQVNYDLGLLDFFENKYDSAEVAFRRLMVDFPRGYYVNDALSLVMVISETKDKAEILDRYAQAMYYSERYVVDSAKASLEGLVSGEGGLLADLALYKLALMETEEGNSTAALAFLERLIEGFAESYYLPHGMKMKADILALSDSSRDEVKEIYRYLLEHYPNYPFVTDVRSRLRELENDPAVG